VTREVLSVGEAQASQKRHRAKLSWNENGSSCPQYPKVLEAKWSREAKGSRAVKHQAPKSQGYYLRKAKKRQSAFQLPSHQAR
jgi:hypothetical protein